MAHELLTGRLPFNDKRNLYNPALSAVLRSILTDKLDFKKPCWADISPEGIDFVKYAALFVRLAAFTYNSVLFLCRHCEKVQLFKTITVVSCCNYQGCFLGAMEYYCVV